MGHVLQLLDNGFKRLEILSPYRLRLQTAGIQWSSLSEAFRGKDNMARPEAGLPDIRQGWPHRRRRVDGARGSTRRAAVIVSGAVRWQGPEWSCAALSVARPRNTSACEFTGLTANPRSRQTAIHCRKFQRAPVTGARCGRAETVRQRKLLHLPKLAYPWVSAEISNASDSPPFQSSPKDKYARRRIESPSSRHIRLDCVALVFRNQAAVTRCRRLDCWYRRRTSSSDVWSKMAYQ